MINFNEKYHPENFLYFLRDFLPSDFTEKEEDIIIKKDRYKEITKAKILGFCESLDAHVLEMDHDHENDPRVTIATDAFKILADHWIHRALVIFKNKDSENYRFSYLTISLDQNDKNKIVKKYSNARRYSFYLGANAKIRTPEQQLSKKGKIKDAEDLLNRFSVEVVNKQFYLEVAKFFDELVSGKYQNLTLPSIYQDDANTRKSFAVRLIGRIMFCWFLKQKKSDNGQLIPDELLSSKIVSDNYYHNTLEPLFFGVLNTAIDSRDIRSDLFDKVPYLNGGLFNPQDDDYYELDRGTFASKHINTLKIKDVWFKNFFGLLETYNFTIDENTVFDQELSVDPEMLGRIFENLLAEINPGTGSSERKRTGSFYTPRQIVEYMVDQSFIEYLKTKTKIDEKKLSALASYDLTDDAEYPLEDNEKQEIISAIESLKILDPACGSGAYPIGALQKIVYILQQIDPDCKLWLEQKLKDVPELYKQKIIEEVKSNPFDYTRKLDVIKNSIFGVDIQPIAVDVSRLRCFLTLIVESEIDDTKPNRGIEPLPNLDFKFVCANTLIGLPKSENAGLFDDHSGIAELSKIMSEYFSCNNQRKNEIKLKFINVQKEILEKTVSAFGKNTGELTLRLTTWNPFSNQSNSWFDPEWMFGLQEKFDIVIGNPPYVQIQKFARTQTQKDLESHNYQSFAKTGDLYALFYERGLELSRKDTGLLCYITSNKWMRAGYGEKLRAYFAGKNPLVLIDLGSGVFESATVDSNILLIRNSANEHDTKVLTLQKTETDLQLAEFSHSAFTSSDPWFIGSNAERKLKEKIESIGKPLKDWDVKINYGIKTGLNEAFIINQAKRDELIAEDPKSTEIIKPILRGRDIKRYGYTFANLYVIATFPALKLDIHDYPAVKKYFEEFGIDRLGQTGEKGSRKKTGNDWFETQDQISYWREFEKEKIVWPMVSTGQSIFALVDENMYLNNKCYLITGQKIKYLTGVLNSKLAWHYFSSQESGLGSNSFEIRIPGLEAFILPAPNEKVEQKITELVSEITTLKKQDPKTNTQPLETQIDHLVYYLYNLTPEEIKIIEGNV